MTRTFETAEKTIRNATDLRVTWLEENHVKIAGSEDLQGRFMLCDLSGFVWSVVLHA